MCLGEGYSSSSININIYYYKLIKCSTSVQSLFILILSLKWFVPMLGNFLDKGWIEVTITELSKSTYQVCLQLQQIWSMSLHFLWLYSQCSGGDNNTRCFEKVCCKTNYKIVIHLPGPKIFADCPKMASSRKLVKSWLHSHQLQPP